LGLEAGGRNWEQSKTSKSDSIDEEMEDGGIQNSTILQPEKKTGSGSAKGCCSPGEKKVIKEGKRYHQGCSLRINNPSKEGTCDVEKKKSGGRESGTGQKCANDRTTMGLHEGLKESTSGDNQKKKKKKSGRRSRSRFI